MHWFTGRWLKAGPQLMNNDQIQLYKLYKLYFAMAAANTKKHKIQKHQEKNIKTYMQL